MGSDLLMAAVIAVLGVLALVIAVVVVTRRARKRPNVAEPPDEETTDHMRGRRRPTPRVTVAPPPLAYVPQPALLQSPVPQPYLPPAAMPDEAPTTADPTWQAKAEAHYAQYRRFARGSANVIHDNDEQRTALGVAPRPMHARRDVVTSRRAK